MQIVPRHMSLPIVQKAKVESGCRNLAFPDSSSVEELYDVSSSPTPSAATSRYRRLFVPADFSHFQTSREHPRVQLTHLGVQAFFLLFCAHGSNKCRCLPYSMPRLTIRWARGPESHDTLMIGCRPHVSHVVMWNLRSSLLTRMPSIRQLHNDTCACCPESPQFVGDIHSIHDTLARIHNGRDSSTTIATNAGCLFGNINTQPAIA